MQITSSLYFYFRKRLRLHLDPIVFNGAYTQRCQVSAISKLIIANANVKCARTLIKTTLKAVWYISVL